jgi:hypothetical protein
LTERCAELEAEVRDHAPASLRSEFFPEAAASGLCAPAPEKSEDELRVIYFVMLVAQQMEDAWLGAELDTYWSHPLNQGWMNYFQRWASTPSFRRWWPVLRPIYSSGFGDFVKERFDIRIRDTDRTGRQDPAGPGARLSLVIPTPAMMGKVREGLAWKSWTERYGPPEPSKGVLAYQLQLETAPEPIQVGFLLYSESSETAGGKKTIDWKSPCLFVPHSLVGAGIQSRFLEAVIGHFRQNDAVERLRVVLEEDVADRKPGADPASRQERVHTLNFYKSRGFQYDRPGADGDLRTLVKDLRN